MADRDYTTIEQVKEFGRTSAVTWASTDDALLARLITQMSAQIDNYCNQDLYQETYAGYEVEAIINRFGGLEFVLPVPLISSVTALTYQLPNSTFNYPVSDLSNVITKDRQCGSRVRVVNVNFCGYRNLGNVLVNISFTGGYAPIGSSGPVPAVPDDIQIAATRLIYWVYQMRMAPNGVMANDQDGAVHVSQNWPGDVKQELKNYRKFV